MAGSNVLKGTCTCVYKCSDARVFIFFCSYWYTEQIYALLKKKLYPFLRENKTIMKVVTLHQVLFDSLKLAVNIMC